jgi:hypothetical protein
MFESCGGSQFTTSDLGPDLGRRKRKRPSLRSKKSTGCHRLAARMPGSQPVDAGSSPAGSAIFIFP